MARLQGALLLAQEGHKKASENEGKALETLLECQQRCQSAKDHADSVKESSLADVTAALAAVRDADKARGEAAAALALLVEKTATENEMYVANCDWLVDRLEDLESGQIDMTEGHIAEVASLRQQLQQQQQDSEQVALQRDQVTLELSRVEGRHEYEDEVQRNYVYQLEGQVQEGHVERQSNKAQLATAHKAVEALTEERNQLGLDLFRAEGMRDNLEEHQGNHVLELEVQVQDLHEDLEAQRVASAATVGAMGASLVKLQRDGQRKDKAQLNKDKQIAWDCARSERIEHQLSKLPQQTQTAFVLAMQRRSNMTIYDFSSQSLRALWTLSQEHQLRVVDDFFRRDDIRALTSEDSFVITSRQHRID